MKKLVFISGALSLSLMVIGALLKMLHIGYGGIILTIACACFALIFIPSLAKFLYDRVK